MNQSAHAASLRKVRMAYNDEQSFGSARVVEIAEATFLIDTECALEPGAKVTITPLVLGPLGIHEFRCAVEAQINDERPLFKYHYRLRFLEPDAMALQKWREHFKS